MGSAAGARRGGAERSRAGGAAREERRPAGGRGAPPARAPAVPLAGEEHRPRSVRGPARLEDGARPPLPRRVERTETREAERGVEVIAGRHGDRALDVHRRHRERLLGHYLTFTAARAYLRKTVPVETAR